MADPGPDADHDDDHDDDHDHGPAAPAPDPADDLCEVVVTGPDLEQLGAFARRLVEGRLAACAQLVGGVRSIYRWEDGIVEEAEARAHLHTRRALVPAIVAVAEAEHPYEVPCVLALPVVGALPAYARWVRDETTGGAPGT